MKLEPRFPLQLRKRHIIKSDMVVVEHHFGDDGKRCRGARLLQALGLLPDGGCHIGGAKKPGHIDIAPEILVLHEERDDPALQRRAFQQGYQGFHHGAAVDQDHAGVVALEDAGAFHDGLGVSHPVVDEGAHDADAVFEQAEIAVEGGRRKLFEQGLAIRIAVELVRGMHPSIAAFEHGAMLEGLDAFDDGACGRRVVEALAEALLMLGIT